MITFILIKLLLNYCSCSQVIFRIEIPDKNKNYLDSFCFCFYTNKQSAYNMPILRTTLSSYYQCCFIKEQCNEVTFRACTGFDGGFEVGEAIRRLLDCVSTGNLNINADEQYALAA